MKRNIYVLMLATLLAANAADLECTINESGQIVCEENCGVWGHCPQ